jgi:GDP-D-mannose 3',5'-epimerase
MAPNSPIAAIAAIAADYTFQGLHTEPYWPSSPLRISISGAGGFIASHIARRLKREGHYIIASDWKKNEHMPEDMFCHEFHLVDLRVMDNCLAVTKGVHHVFNLAADMGGMGFIQSNHSVIMYNNTMISFNMLEAARINGVSRYNKRILHITIPGEVFLVHEIHLHIGRFTLSSCIHGTM